MALKGAHNYLIAYISEQEGLQVVDSLPKYVDFSTFLVGRGRFTSGAGSSLTGLYDDSVRHWVFLEKLGVGTTSPIETISTTRDLHGRRGFSP